MFFPTPAPRLSFSSLDEIPEGHVPEHNSIAAGTFQATDMTPGSVGSVSHSNFHVGPIYRGRQENGLVPGI